MNELQTLLNHLKHSARVALGCWSDSIQSGHNGLAAFFLHEEGQRHKDALDIANHLADREHVMFGALPAPVNEYATCVDAAHAFVVSYEQNLQSAISARDSLIAGSMNTYFMNNFVEKMGYELEQAKGIWQRLRDTEKESLPELNRQLMAEYGRG